MTTEQKFKSDAFAAIHASAAALQKAGAIDQTTMRQFDETCIVLPTTLAPTQIKIIREHAHVSQPVFARYLNISESTVQKWESGSKQPSGMALKLLAVVQKHGLGVLHKFCMAALQRVQTFGGVVYWAIVGQHDALGIASSAFDRI